MSRAQGGAAGRGAAPGGAWAVALVWAVLAGCAPPAPEIVDVAWPGDTRDPLGPYTVTVVTAGAVDRVALVWQVGDAAAETTALVGGGERWVGQIPGQPVGSVVAVAVAASGPGGAVEVAGEGFAVLDPSGRCLVDGDCLGGDICRGRVCGPRPAVCADDEDCPQDRFCPAPGEPCRFRPTRCAVDGDCAAGFVCVDAECVAPARCRGDVDCPGGVCLIPPGRCAPPGSCGDDGDCDAGFICVAGTCEPDIAQPCPVACGEGRVCHPPSGRCVACTADGHCPGGHCDVGALRCAEGARGQPCVPCGPGLPCGAGFGCPSELGGVCLPVCDAAGGCPPGAACDGRLCLPTGRRFCSGVECGIDEDCASGVCFAGYCEAAQLCARDADCAAGRRCEGERCVVLAPGCQNPGDCPAGSVCLGGRCAMGRPGGACGRCTFNRDCASPALCLPFMGGVRRCAVACGGGDCPGEALACVSIDRGIALCLDRDGQCPEVACGVDALEPNDAAAQAVVLPPEARVEAVVCARDVDWFALSGAEASLAVATAGELSVEVLDGAEMALRQVRVPAGGSVEVAVPAEGAWLRVSSAVAADVGYVLSLVELPSMCVDDRFEENDAAGAATVIGGGALVNGVACPGDTDWFRVRTRGEAGVVEVEPEAGQGPLAVTLWRGDVVIGAETSIEPMSLALPAGVDDVGVEVVCRACQGALRYRLATRLGAPACRGDDGFAPNHARAEAAALGGRFPIAHGGLIACGGIEDWFVFDRPAGVSVQVSLAFSHLAGDLALAVFDADGRWRGRADGNGDVEIVEVPGEVAGARLWVAVSMFGAGQTVYTLRVDVVD